MEIAEAKLFGEACASQPLARYINTQQTVWDLDFLRQLMEDEQGRSTYDKLNYVGYSYGTWLGAWYADTYPTRVGRFILDSNMQWTASMYANQTLDSKSFQRRRDAMLFPYLARHNADFGLGKSAKSVKKKYESTRKKLATKAKKALKKGKTPVLGPEDLDYIVASLIYSDEGFVSAGYIVDAAADYAKKGSSGKNRRTLEKRIKAPMSRAPFLVQRTASKIRGSALVSLDLAGTIVRCNDSADAGQPDPAAQAGRCGRQEVSVHRLPEHRPPVRLLEFKPQTRTIDFSGLQSKMLMFQSEGDPATAYEGALSAHRRTAAKTVLVSVDNEGQHGLYVDGPSTCLEAIGDRFLFSRVATLPARDTRCTTSPLPYDRKVYSLAGPVSGATSSARTAVKARNSTLKAVRADVAKRALG